jgi:hypothetical protein
MANSARTVIALSESRVYYTESYIDWIVTVEEENRSIYIPRDSTSAERTVLVTEVS